MSYWNLTGRVRNQTPVRWTIFAIGWIRERHKIKFRCLMFIQI